MNDLLRTAIMQDSVQPRELVSIGQKKGSLSAPCGLLKSGIFSRGHDCTPYDYSEDECH